MAQSGAVMPRDRGVYVRLACEGAFWSRTSGPGGSRYELGTGVAQDVAEAVRWYGKAAEQGNADAQYKLGVMSEQLPRAATERTARDMEGRRRWRRAVR